MNEQEQFEEEINKAAEEAYEEAFAKINEQLNEEITFALIGEVNSGKSSTINLLLDEEVATVGAEPGETVAIRKYKYKGQNHIVFVDTPGLNDINQDNSQETENFFKKTDIILFFLNAAGTVFSEREKETFDKLKKINNNILFILNKIDAADDIDATVQYVKTHTNNAYKVIPISSRTGENIDNLNEAILNILKKKGKEIIYARSMKLKSPVANKWILGASTSAGAVGALPIPGSDIIPITTIQVGLLVRLATLYDKPLSKKNATELAIATITGNIGKTAFRQIAKFIPGAGSIAGAGIAASMTFGLGHAIKYSYENNLSISASSIKVLAKKFSKKEL